MVTDSEGYVQLIEYLTAHLSLFEQSSATRETQRTVIATIEEELSNQIMAVCNQHEQLTVAQRSRIIGEIDSIVYDLEEILSGVMNNQVTAEQEAFIKEFSILLKNLFDSYIQDL